MKDGDSNPKHLSLPERHFSRNFLQRRRQPGTGRLRPHSYCFPGWQVSSRLTTRRGFWHHGRTRSPQPAGHRRRSRASFPHRQRFAPVWGSRRRSRSRAACFGSPAAPSQTGCSSHSCTPVRPLCARQSQPRKSYPYVSSSQSDVNTNIPDNK